MSVGSAPLAAARQSGHGAIPLSLAVQVLRHANERLPGVAAQRLGAREPDERLGHLVLRACFVEKPENIDESPLGEIPLVDKSAFSINNSR